MTSSPYRGDPFSPAPPSKERTRLFWFFSLQPEPISLLPSIRLRKVVPSSPSNIRLHQIAPSLLSFHTTTSPRQTSIHRSQLLAAQICNCARALRNDSLPSSSFVVSKYRLSNTSTTFSTSRRKVSRSSRTRSPASGS